MKSMSWISTKNTLQIVKADSPETKYTLTARNAILECSCGFTRAMLMPCEHMLRVLTQQHKESTILNYFDPRWHNFDPVQVPDDTLIELKRLLDLEKKRDISIPNPARTGISISVSENEEDTSPESQPASEEREIDQEVSSTSAERKTRRCKLFYMLFLYYYRLNPNISVNKGRKPNEERIQSLSEKIIKASTSTLKKKRVTITKRSGTGTIDQTVIEVLILTNILF